MSSKVHVSGKIKSVSIANRNRVVKESKQFKLTINMVDGNKVFLYTDEYGMRKIKKATDEWWRELYGSN